MLWLKEIAPSTVRLLVADRDEEHKEAVELRNILQAWLSNA